MSRLVRPKKTPQISNRFLGIPENPLWAPAEPKTLRNAIRGKKQKIGALYELKKPLLKNPTKKKKKKKKKKREKREKRETRFYLDKTKFDALKKQLAAIVDAYKKSEEEATKKEYMNQLWKNFLAYKEEWNKFLKKAHGQCAPGHTQHAADAYHTVVHCENTIIPHIDQIADQIKNFDEHCKSLKNQVDHRRELLQAEETWSGKILSEIEKLGPVKNESVINDWIRDRNLANDHMVTTWKQIFSNNETELLHFFAYLWKYKWHNNEFLKLYKDLTNAKIISSDAYGKKWPVLIGFWDNFLKKVEELAETVKVNTEKAEKAAEAKAAADNNAKKAKEAKAKVDGKNVTEWKEKAKAEKAAKAKAVKEAKAADKSLKSFKKLINLSKN